MQIYTFNSENSNVFLSFLRITLINMIYKDINSTNNIFSVINFKNLTE